MPCHFCLALLSNNSTDIIDTKSKEIRAENNDTYSKLEDIADELPDSSPRFILLSYPHTLVRLSTHLYSRC